MMCNSRTSGKKKIVIFAVLSIASIGLTYVAFTTHNIALAVATPVLLAFIPCLVMCGVIGGSMLLIPRLSKNKNVSSCGCGMNHSIKNKNDATEVSK